MWYIHNDYLLWEWVLLSIDWTKDAAAALL